MEKPKLPIVGEFVAQCGCKVRVRAATFEQVSAIALAADDTAAATRATRALIDACAEPDGLPKSASPSSILTVGDGKRVLQLSQGEGSDFT